MNRTFVVDILGWVGVVVLLAAYWAVSTRRMEGSGIAFQLLNIAGAALLIVNSYDHGALPSVSVNVAWMAIGGYALMRALLARQETRVPPLAP
jgi:hypothetical protein